MRAYSSCICSQQRVRRILTATAMALPIMPSWLIGVLNTKHEATMMITRFSVLATLCVTGDRRSKAYKTERKRPLSNRFAQKNCIIKAISGVLLPQQ
jgi:hypothetical protein